MLLSYINILISLLLSFVDSALHMLGLEKKTLPIFTNVNVGFVPMVSGENAQENSTAHVSSRVRRLTSTVSGRKKWLTNSSIFILWFGSLIPASFSGAGRGLLPFLNLSYSVSATEKWGFTEFVRRRKRKLLVGSFF